MRSVTDSTALKKYLAMITVDDNTGKSSVKADDILSLPWQDFAELVAMHNLPQVDHVMVEDVSSRSLIYWMMKDLPMKQTILLWLTCSAMLIGSTINNSHRALSAFIGFMSWIPIEYGYHRFIGHMPVTNDFTKKANFYLHGKHHFASNDLNHVLLPPLPISIIAFFIYQFIFVNTTKNPQMALAFLILHYLTYDIMHYAMHKITFREVSQVPLIGNVLMRLWGNHLRHHREPEINFFVTTGGLLKSIAN